jgi:hypothetical protein
MQRLHWLNMEITDNLIEQISNAEQLLIGLGVNLPDELSANIDALKTVDYFRRVLRKSVLDFWRGDIDVSTFLDKMIYTVENQLRRAWNEGMRAVGLDPKEDMTPEFQAILDGVISKEFDYILNFAQAVQDARDEEKPIEPLYQRVELWANRYNEVVNLAKTETGSQVKFVWELGRTELHCSTCFGLNGIVAFGYEWKNSGYKPQAAPNAMLECGGWRCDCRLNQTTRYRTRGGIPKI